MDTTRQATLAQQALSEIEQLLSNYDLGGQLEAALPLLLRQRRTLIRLNKALIAARRATKPRSDEQRWVDDLVAVYRELHGQALDSIVYRSMKQLRQRDGRSWPPSAQNAIRQTRQAYNAESPQYRGGADLFRMVRPGFWRLRDFRTH